MDDVDPRRGSDPAVDAFARGDSAAARRISLGRLRRSSDPADAVAAGCMLGRISMRDGDLDGAGRHVRDAVVRARATGDRAILQEPLHLQAALARLSGDLLLARDRFVESIELNLEMGVPGAVAVERRNLGYVELHLGNVEEAERLFELSRSASGSEARTSVDPGALLDRAVLAARRGDPDGARRLLSEVRDRYRADGRVPDPDESQEIELLDRELRAPAPPPLSDRRSSIHG